MNATSMRLISAGAVLAMALGATIPARAAPLTTTTVIVKPTAMNGWLFYNDENDTINNSLGSFVNGPGKPALPGVGSAQISVSGTQRRNLATYQFSGTPLANITDLKYRTYNPSAGNGGSSSRSGFLFFNVDFNGSDTWQRRILFLPSDNGTVTQNAWKEWDTINGGAALWRYSGTTWPGGAIPGTTPKTWSQILADYPGVRVRVTDALLGIRVGEPYSDGYTENIDTLTFGTGAGTTIFDFEPSMVVVRPTALNGWLFYNDETDVVDNTLGSFVTGPGTPLSGVGSAKISVSGTQRRNLATYQFSGTPLASITTLKYSTYNPSAGNGGSSSRSGYLQFNVDFNGSDTWQRRILFLPSDNGTVTQNAWKEWDTINGGAALWRYSGTTWPGGAIPGTTPKTWTQILTDYPGVRIRVTDAFLGIRVGEPYADGYTENIDSLTFNGTLYDFEPAGLTIAPATTLVAAGSPFGVDLVLNGAANVYGYQFQFDYPTAVGTATGSFVNTLFDTTSNASVPAGWNAACASGACKFAASKVAPAGPIAGTGALGHVAFTAGATPGVYTLSYSGVILSDPDAMPIPVGTQTASVTIYGTATINGNVKLQGRATPLTPGVIFLADTSATFPAVATTFDAAGNFSIAVSALPGGTTWRIIADHSLYLANQTSGGTDVTVTPGGTATAATTTLRGGDANNDETVTILDLSCIGGAFGGPPTVCGATGSSDINADGTVNIFDLVLAGGNYGLSSPRPW